MKEFRTLVATFPTLFPLINEGLTGTALLKAIREAQVDQSRGKRHAANFVLHVWNGSEFNLREAWGAWDGSHKKAFQDWAQNPTFF